MSMPWIPGQPEGPRQAQRWMPPVETGSNEPRVSFMWRLQDGWAARTAVPRVWNGAEWVVVRPKRWDGVSWVTMA